MEKYKINSIEDLTPELITALIQRFKLNELSRINQLYNYYNGKPDIMNRVMQDATKENNKVATPIGSYIVDTLLSYVLGIPVAYQSTDELLMLKLQEIFANNYESAHNSSLIKDASICGIGYELLFLSEDGELNFSRLNPSETFIIFDSSIKSKPLAAIRFYETQSYIAEESTTHIEVYTADTISTYKLADDDMQLTNEQQHYFKDVPVIAYYNSDQLDGVFEKVKTLIDTYDLVQSDSVNSLEAHVNAFLVISGMDVQDEDIPKMKENRVLVTGESGGADWLVKPSEPSEIENLKKRIKEDIHAFSHVPNLSDEKFAAQSGEALKFKLHGIENRASIMERYIKRSIEKRIKLITNYLNLKGSRHDNNDVVMQFSRNMPSNLKDISEVVTSLRGMISDETLISLLPFVDDVALEVALLKQQNEDSVNGLGAYEFPEVIQTNSEDLTE